LLSDLDGLEHGDVGQCVGMAIKGQFRPTVDFIERRDDPDECSPIRLDANDAVLIDLLE
jgi:hypothetical protein